jgi:IgA Peptidase M64/FG-GAP-like repeat
MPDSVTQIRAAGPVGSKRNLAVLGDGFADADQSAYDDWVQTTLIDGVFGHDYFYEDASAWNIFRVNLISVDSGVNVRIYDEHGTTADPKDDTIVSTTTRDTALGMIFSGSWAHCWMEYSADSESLLNAALHKWVPDYNFVLVVLNTTGYGGCGGDGRAHVTIGDDWTTIAHEFGHGLGGLADEYCVSGSYSGSKEPGSVDLTIDTDRSTMKWGRFVDPGTPLPTGTGACAGYNQGTPPAGWDDNQDVGLFEGGGTLNTGIYRPVINCRMRSNIPPYCPVCYTSFKQQYDGWTGHTFLNAYAGDFSGDGKSDVLVHSGNSIQIFRSNGAQLDLVFSAVERVPGSWQFQPNDRFYVGDFNGDGKDEVVVFNGVDWAMPYLGLLADDAAGGLRLIARFDGDIPGWGGFAHNDLFYVGDFNGDGKDDLFVFNGADWSTTYVAMLRSTGTGFDLIRRFDGDIPGWGGLARNDQLFVGDFSGDGRADLYIFNGQDWSMGYVGMFRSTGKDLQMTARYDGDIPGWGGLARHDQLYVGDFDGDGWADLYIFNGVDWSMSYLGMFQSTGARLQMAHRYDGDVPGWGGLASHDRFLPADINGDGKTDLFVYNTQDWATEYLGRMRSTGSALVADFVGDWVGEWNLGPSDRYEVCNFEGARGQRDLFIHNQDWFGMISGWRSLSLRKIYYRWIHNYRYGRNW